MERAIVGKGEREEMSVAEINLPACTELNKR